jgi:hypothetical protein
MQEPEILQGVIGAVVYQNYDNGYSVLRLRCQDGQTVTVVGIIPLPAVGERLMVTGKWSSHPSYGKQFEAEFLERLLPETTTEITAYLSSRVIKGIGPKIAARIVAHFGEDTLRIMEREPARLAEVTGISAAKAQQIGEDFLLQVGLRHLMEFFTLHHLPAELAVQTYKLYGESAIDALYEDPYLLTEEEFDQIKTHPILGSRILSKITEMPKLAVGARWHHERFDGTGYPDGLMGEEILEEARIIAVADAYDAMSSYRSYRDALPQETVRNELERCSGTQFDPRFAEIMLQMIADDSEYSMREKG